MNHQVHHFIARTQLNLSAAFSLGNYSVLFPHAFTLIVLSLFAVWSVLTPYGDIFTWLF